MSGQDLYLERSEAVKSLRASMDRFTKNGKLYATANRSYRIALRQKILELKAKGYAVTLIPKLAKGDPEVADYELQLIIAENAYKASQENINVQKIILRSIEDEIQREWRS